MALRNRTSNSNSSSTESISKKSMKRAQRDIKKTSLAKNKFGGILGIFILIFGVIYLVFIGTYIYKRKTGQTSSALNHENPFFGFNPQMEALKHAIKIDENGKVVVDDEALKRYKEIYGDTLPNSGPFDSTPSDSTPSDSTPNKDEENIEEVGNEDENENEAENKPENENIPENENENQNAEAAPEGEAKDTDADADNAKEN